MTTLSVDTPRVFEEGKHGDYPVVASDIIYDGSAVGLVKSSGHVQPLTSSDKFVGFTDRKYDNSAGAAGDIYARVARRGCIKLAVSGAVINDVGRPVYASDDNSFSFVKTSGVFIGFVKSFESSGYVKVDFDIDNYVDPHEGYTPETVADNKTLDAQDTGKVFFVTADAKTITLPAVEGMAFRVVNAGAYGTIAVNISPNASDFIKGPNLAGVDDKDLINTKATANRGDYVDIEFGDATGWIVRKLKGTWAMES